MPDIPSNVIDLGAIRRPQQQVIPPVVLLGDIPVEGQPVSLVTARMLIDAIMAGVRDIVREELNAAVNITNE